MDSPRRSCDRRGVAFVGSYGCTGESEWCTGTALQKCSGKCVDAVRCLSSCEQNGPGRGQAPPRRRPWGPVDRPKIRDLMGFCRSVTVAMALVLGYSAAASAQQAEETQPSSTEATE